MVESISISYEWILGIIITFSIAIFGLLINYIWNFKKDFEKRLRYLEDKNTENYVVLDTIKKTSWNYFVKGEKRK